VLRLIREFKGAGTKNDKMMSIYRATDLGIGLFSVLPLACHLDRSMTAFCHAQWRDPQFVCAGDIASLGKPAGLSTMAAKNAASGRDDNSVGNSKNKSSMSVRKLPYRC
jgi:hypothetical protein